MHSSDLSMEPAAIQALSDEQQLRLADVLDQYLRSLERGMPVDPTDLIAEHPDLKEPLQAYLRSLVHLHDLAAGFSPAAAEKADRMLANELPGSDLHETRLGDFVLGRELGRGGMGVVYEARQISLNRRVAVKVLPFAAVLDGKQIARFTNEAQAAAQLHHPNIVPVFAVGVERGVHYYAMQLIEGQPLDRAIAQLRQQAEPTLIGEATQNGPLARERHAWRERPDAAASTPSLLTSSSSSRRDFIRTILQLGIQAAGALQAAHEYGIVHRDIKPSNLLLDADGKLWVTDFGLARFRHDGTLTRSGDIVGTMRYMSPEQAAGKSELVDHRSDIYSLAVTLYELLTLQPAIAGNNGPALLRAIDLQEPPRLRKLRPEIPRDLETVIRKAMAKQPSERYGSAELFAGDLRCVLEGKPTAARPPGLCQRAAKWSRRHQRVVVVAVCVGLLTVLGSIITTLLVARERSEAERNYRRAEKNFQSARRAVDRFGSHFAQRLAGIPGAEEVRRDVLRETLAYYQDFIDQARDDPALRADLALAHSKIADVTEQLGSNDDAIEAHRAALRIWRQLVADNGTGEDRRKLALCSNNLALACQRAGRVDEARDAFQEAIDLQEQLASGTSGSHVLQELALTYGNFGQLQSETGQASEAKQLFRRAIQLQEQLTDAQSDDPQRLRSTAAAYNNLGGLLLPDDPAAAIDLYAKAVDLQLRASAARPGDPKYRNDLALAYNNLASGYSHGEDLSAAAEAYRKAIEIQQVLVDESPGNKRWRCDLAVTLNNYALALSRLGRAEEAEQSLRETLRLHESLIRQFPGDVGLLSSLGGVYNNLAIVLEEMGRLSEAEESYRQAIERQREAHERAPAVERYRAFLSKHYLNYGRTLRRLGRGELAMQAALARKELWPREPQHLLAVAEELAQAGNLMTEQSPTAVQRQECVDETLGTLQQAVTLGCKLPHDLADRESFASVRNEQRFKDLNSH